MGGQYGVLFLTIGFFIIVVVVVAAFVFFIYTAAQLKKMAVRLDTFCSTTEESLKPVLEETEKTLKSVRTVTDNIGAVTGDIREVTEAASEVADNIRAVSMIVTDVREQVSLKTHGVMAGIQAALGVLMKHKK